MLGVFAVVFTTLFAAPQAAPRPAAALAVTGVVQDQTTAVLPDAQVELRLTGSPAPSAVTIVLPFEGMSQEVSVSLSAARTRSPPASMPSTRAAPTPGQPALGATASRGRASPTSICAGRAISCWRR